MFVVDFYEKGVKSLRLQGLPVPSSVTASPCHLPPREGILPGTFAPETG
jgi:hypothetical protein